MIRPVTAPTIRPGRNTPPGTRHPNVTIVSSILMIRAVKRRYKSRGISDTSDLNDIIILRIVAYNQIAK